MDRNHLLSTLKKFGPETKETYLDQAFARNIGLLTHEEQQRLGHATVAIPGMGGVGGVHLITMVRTGVGRFHLSDFDIYEPANINRQYGATIPDFGRKKLEVMKEHALSINPYLDIKEFPEGISEKNVDDFLEGVDVVLDSLDFFAFDARRLLFNRAREKGVFVVTAGPIGFSSAMLIFSPYEGMSFDEYFNIKDGMEPQDQYLSYAIGLTPRATQLKYMDLSKVDLKAGKGPSLNIACQLCSGMAATEAVKIILKREDVKPVPNYYQFDPYLHKYCKGKLLLGNRNPIQQLKMMIAKKRLKNKKEFYRRIMPEFPASNVTEGQLPEDAIHYIIQAGIQAPSGDNAQPWKFSFSENKIYLYLDRDADHSFFNINQIASIISCGAVLENMRITATAFGLACKIDYLPDTGQKDLMASLEFSHTKVNKDPLADFIWHRKTNRTKYAKSLLPSSLFQELEESVSDLAGIKLHFITEKERLKKIAKLVFMVDQIRTEHRGLHEHLSRMIRFTHGESLEKKDGLPLENLEAGLTGEIFLKLTRPWPVMNITNKIGLGKLIALHSYQGIINSSGAVLVTVDGMENQDFLQGGQAVERLWLSLTKKGLAMQPMTAITLFWLRWHLKGEADFAEDHRRLLGKVWRDYRSLFSDIDFTRHGHVMLMRFGYGKEITSGTYRKDLKSFIE